MWINRQLRHAPSYGRQLSVLGWWPVMSRDVQHSRRSHPLVAPEDSRLAHLLREVQWLCDDVAPDVPGHRVDPDKLAELMDQLPALQDGLRGYARRVLARPGEQVASAEETSGR